MHITSGRFILGILACLFCGELGFAVGVLHAAAPRCIPLEVFLREGSSRSTAAREFVETTYRDRDGVTLVLRDVGASQDAADRFWKLADHFKLQKPGLPAFYVAGRFESGWNVDSTPRWLEESLTVEAFVREGCPRCKAAHPVIFDRLATRYPGLRFVERDLVKSRDAGRRLQELTARYRVQATSVPALHLGGRLVIGFKGEEASFREWDRILSNISTSCPDVPSSVQQPRAARSTEASLTSGRRLLEKAKSPFRLAGFVTAPPEQDTRGTASQADRTLDEVPPRRDLPPETDRTALPLETAGNDEVVTLPMLGDVDWRDWGMPAFTLLVGLIDGFNPCAMWVLLFLLSVLVNLQDRWKILAVAGTFVAISGLAYLTFMAAWLNIFRFIGFLRPAQITLGLLGATIGAIHVKDFFAFKKGISLSIPESVKPGLYARVRRIVTAENLWGAILGASVLATLVNVIELLCTAGLPAMYTGILTMQEYPPWANYMYLTLYIAGYMFDDSVMVGIVVVTLGRHKLQERGGRVLKLVSGAVILVLSCLMIFKPEWLV